MTVVGDKQLLATETLLLADDEVGRFDVRVDSDTQFAVSIRCIRPDDGEPVARWQFVDGVLKLTLTGWNNPFGDGFRSPQPLGDQGGNPIGFNFTHQRLGSINHLTLQFYLGGRYE